MGRIKDLLGEKGNGKVTALKSMADGEINKGDQGNLILNKDGSVTVEFPQRDSAVDFKNLKLAMRFVKKA